VIVIDRSLKRYQSFVVRRYSTFNQTCCFFSRKSSCYVYTKT